MEALRCEATSPRLPVFKDSVERVSCVFTSLTDGAGIDPSEVIFTAKAPDGDITTLNYGTDAALVRDAAGVFHVDVSLEQPGVWHYRFEGKGTHGGLAEGQITVKASGVE